MISKIISAFLLAITMIASAHADEFIHQPPALEYDPNVPQVELSETEWQAILSPIEYDIIRQQGTEKAFTGQYDKFYETGTYICAACGQPLFSSTTKYDSTTGWPSFWAPINNEAIGTQPDTFLFFTRTEVHCARCGGHLGHVFEDGPEPTGLRYCINSVSLSFIPAN